MRRHVHCTQRSFTSITALSVNVPSPHAYFCRFRISQQILHTDTSQQHTSTIKWQNNKGNKFGQYERKRAQVQWPTPELLILYTDRIININQSILSCVFDLHWKRSTVSFHSFVVRRTNASQRKAIVIYSHLYSSCRSIINSIVFIASCGWSWCSAIDFHIQTEPSARSLSTWRNVDTWKIKFSTYDVHVSLFIFMRWKKNHLPAAISFSSNEYHQVCRHLPSEWTTSKHQHKPDGNPSRVVHKDVVRVWTVTLSLPKTHPITAFPDADHADDGRTVQRTKWCGTC